MYRIRAHQVSPRAQAQEWCDEGLHNETRRVHLLAAGGKMAAAAAPWPMEVHVEQKYLLM